MSDELRASGGEEQPRLPTKEEVDQASVIDPEALKHWFEIPADAEVELTASRADLDRLFMGLRMMSFAQGETLAALQEVSHGRTEQAQVFFVAAANHQAQALANVSLFTTGLMAKAKAHG